MPLSQRRRLAVQLRLSGLTLGEISRQANLSAPTIIAAHKAYLDGGWEAVDSKIRGRRPGQGRLTAEIQPILSAKLHNTMPESANPAVNLWTYARANQWLRKQGYTLSPRAASGYFQRWGFSAENLLADLRLTSDASLKQWLSNEYQSALQAAKLKGASVIWAGVNYVDGQCLFYLYTLRKKFYWLNTEAPLRTAHCIDFLSRAQQELGSPLLIVMKGIELARANELKDWLAENVDTLMLIPAPLAESHPPAPVPLHAVAQNPAPSPAPPSPVQTASDAPVNSVLPTAPARLTHLQRLEAQSIHIMREVVAAANNPVMLFSMGKDSAVMLHLARKAFYPGDVPFPLLHIDTTWKFREMYEYQHTIATQPDIELLCHVNQQGVAQGVNPFTHGTDLHTHIMETEGLKQALDQHHFDIALGGARRDEEQSRAKERVFSLRDREQHWNPQNQRPELWRLYNTRKHGGESLRVFPLSDWTELDVWQYILAENIPVVPLYLAAERPIVERDDALIMVDDERLQLLDGEVPLLRKIRFRTLGCYPLTSAIDSSAASIPQMIHELFHLRTSERQGRLIDHDHVSSMEKKKQEGYF